MSPSPTLRVAFGSLLGRRNGSITSVSTMQSDSGITFDVLSTSVNSVSPDPANPVKTDNVTPSATPSPTAWSFEDPIALKPVPKETASRWAPFSQLARKFKKTGRSTRGQLLNSRTLPEDLPKSWAAYSAMYSQRKIDIEDPPLPPSRAALEAVAGHTLPPTPFDESSWIAPYPEDESERQAIVTALDLRGVHRSTLSAASSTPTSSTSPDPPSIENLPALQSIVTKAQESFKTGVVMVALLDGEEQQCLATAGLPAEIGSVLPRGSSFCTHMILNGPDGLVVEDSSKDWRFANHPATADMGLRFYAGVPLYAPGSPTNAAIIGAFCVLDSSPNRDFDNQNRAMLKEYSAQATQQIGGWTAARGRGQLD